MQKESRTSMSTKKEDTLAEVNFTGPVLLKPGAPRALWNAEACLGTKMILDGRELRLMSADGKETIRVIPYHMVRDYRR